MAPVGLVIGCCAFVIVKLAVRRITEVAIAMSHTDRPGVARKIGNFLIIASKKTNVSG
jgi:hypothetical protein